MTSTADNREDEAIGSDAEEAAKLFDYVRFTFSDFHGIARGQTVARRNFNQFFSNGLALFSGTLAFGPRSEINFVPDEVNQLNLGNMTVKPMSGTLHSIPWATEGKHRVGEVLCETFWIPPFRGGAPQAACPRYIARRQLDELEKLGYRLYSGFEAEFIVLDAKNQAVFTGVDIFNTNLLAEFESLIYTMDEKMAAAGVNVATMNTEYGDGQFEMALIPKYGIETADQLFLLKQAVKQMAKQHEGWQATFMSKPFIDKTGSGLHYSHSLWSVPSTGSDEESHNVFHDPSTEDGLSTIARHWIAGLLRHGRGLMALCSPTVNCYRRIGPCFTPNYGNWGINDRNAAIRVKTGHPTATYFENRLPGGAANPYLVLAATVAAGMDGILKNLEPPTPMISARQVEGKESQSSDNTSSVEPFELPKNLSESLAALENDSVLGEALGKEFIHWFVNSKRANEIAKVAKASELDQTEIEVERELYFSVL